MRLSLVRSASSRSSVSSDRSASPIDRHDPCETSKLRELLALLKNSVGVADLASVRVSLPSTLLHPMGTLEFWTYAFAAIGQSEDPLERMISVLRWSITKDLKWAKGDVVKPYNPVLGEQFRSIWDAKPMAVEDDEPRAYDHLDEDVMDSSQSSSGESSAMADSPQPIGGEALRRPHGTARVAMLKEQISHHPPASAFWAESLSAGPGHQRVQSYGIDQISAKFTGTSVKCGPGSVNKGIFVALPDRGGEEYQITHPTANICGLLRGSLYVTFGESSIITQRPSRSGKATLRAICSYPDESWVGKARYRIEGAVFEVTEEDEDQIPTKLKNVPEDRIIARFEGNWREKVVWWRTRGSDLTKRTIVDLTPLLVAPKQVRPMELLSPLESRKLWKDVTQSIIDKEFNQATKHKQIIEQLQRDKAKQREEKGQNWTPAFFELDYSDGRPKLSENGQDAIKKDLEGVGYA